LAVEDLANLVRRPDKELALLALAVGVLRRIETSLRIEHFPHDIVQDFLGDGAEELVAGDLPGVQIDAGQLGVVV
jgi:hypothetical protein